MQDTKSGNGVGHGPEGGHEHQTGYDVLVIHEEGTYP
jgi:hypothetical protein